MNRKRIWLPMLAAAGLASRLLDEPSGTPEDEVATFDARATPRSPRPIASSSSPIWTAARKRRRWRPSPTARAWSTSTAPRKKLLWEISYNDLSSPVTAAHFHGPVGPGVAAGVQLKMAPTNATTNRIAGEATLTDEQMRQVLGGLWYVNIHTEKYPDGEIRGQVENAGM